MADIVITHLTYNKYDQLNVKALTEQGLSALAEVNGSKCASITIARRRLNYAKDFLTQRGCCVVVVPSSRK
jgi:hypothetical protein